MNEICKISGVVIKGESRGKDLGFPTANIALHQDIPEGIYAASVIFNGKSYHSAAFVGSAKTFERSEVKLEAFILNFSGNLYGKRLTVKLYKKIRDNKKFKSVKELVEQMKKRCGRDKSVFCKQYFLT